MRTIICIVGMALLSGCTTKMSIGQGKSGIPIRKATPVEITYTDIFEFRDGIAGPERSKLGQTCAPTSRREVKTMAWGPEERLRFKMPFLGRGKAAATLNEDGTLSSVKLDSDSTAAMKEAAGLAATALPLWAQLEALKKITEPIDRTMDIVEGATNRNNPTGGSGPDLRSQMLFNMTKTVPGASRQEFSLKQCLANIHPEASVNTSPNWQPPASIDGAGLIGRGPIEGVVQQPAIRPSEKGILQAEKTCFETATRLAEFERSLIRAQQSFEREQARLAAENARDQAFNDSISKMTAQQRKDYFCVRVDTFVSVKPL